MSLHPRTFDYLEPTDQQRVTLSKLQEAAVEYAVVLDTLLPDGPDKSHILRWHRSNVMWANVAVTRHPDGTPRS